MTSVSRLLLQHGFGTGVVVSVLSKLPVKYHEDRPAFQHLPSLLDDSLMRLRTSNVFSEGTLINMLLISPAVLFTDIYTVLETHERLKQLFTSQHSTAIISKFPEIITQQWDVVEEKFNYAYFDMGCHQKEIVRSNLFSHTLEHIQDRHLFIFRTGNFVHSSKEPVETRLNPNIKLSSIVDSSLEDFVQLCGVSDPEEFYAFLNIREIERACVELEMFSDEEMEEVFTKKKKKKELEMFSDEEMEKVFTKKKKKKAGKKRY